MKRMSGYVVPIGIGIFVVALWLLRYVAFGVLMFVRPVVNWLFGGAAILFLLGLILGLMIAPEHHNMLWGFLCAGVLSTGIVFGYDILVLALAPNRFPILLAR